MSGFDVDDRPAPREHTATPFSEILERRISRRTVLKGTALAGAQASLLGQALASEPRTAPAFKELTHGLDETLHVPEGYTHQVVLAWGDPIFADAQAFDPYRQSAKAQSRQFGYNNDFVAFLPLPGAAHPSTAGLLVVNHEYASSAMMHPGSPDAWGVSREQSDIEMQAHGLSIVEVQKQGRAWKIQPASGYNRRITPHTPMRFAGPARGHRRLKTGFSPEGIRSMGTFGNCAGQRTPWGTVLTAEENVQFYFMGEARLTDEMRSYKRFGMHGSDVARSAWGMFHEHWNLDLHPQAGMHAGWIVEIDPFDANFVPVKRTALGRCKHEGCDVFINPDGRVVLYMGDDQAFEYIYRFVSRHRYRPGDRVHNLSLLDEGELSVAEFEADGSFVWHPLVFGRGACTPANGFASQADVVIDMRKAADLAGATPMDRPEEIKVDPVSGHVFAILTNNMMRTPLAENPANPRAFNRHGHILELIAPQGDHRAKFFKWDTFIFAGDPKRPIDQARYHPDISEHGWFSCPDNGTFDPLGNLWIATDGFEKQGVADGIWVSATRGIERALPRHFLRAPRGAEICSPCFTPDYRTMFCSVQHPGEGSSFDEPSTRWPDFDGMKPPRPSVVAIAHEREKVLGS
ncbi:MAG: PhoX family phosphatase [Gammaproteobacteria bacterium]|nr:PhoX family phosphatase [Gammaproteobacteria bacterium]